MSRAARRAQVLDLAEALFAQQGYHHVAMDDIADRAEVSKPVLYRHFPGKLDLYLAVIDRLSGRLLAAVDAHAGRELAEALTRGFLDFVEASDGTYALLLESDVTHDEAVRDRVEYALAELVRRATVRITAAAGRPDPAAALAASGIVRLAATLAVHRHRVGAPDVATAATLGTALVDAALAATAPSAP